MPPKNSAKKSNKNNFLKKRNHASVWRKNIESSVVDLSNAKSLRSAKNKARKAVPISDIKPKTVYAAKNISPKPKNTRLYTEEDQYNALKYLRELGQKRSSDPTREDITKELEDFDKADLAIQQNFTPPAYQPVQDSYGAEKISFIPKDSAKAQLQEEISAPQPTPKVTQAQQVKYDTGSKDRKYRKEILKKNKEEKEYLFKKTQALPRKKRGYAKKAFATVVVVAFALLAASSFVYATSLSLKDDAQVHAETAYSYMQLGREALSELDPPRARDNFIKAGEEFSKIEQSFGFLGSDLMKLAAKFPVQTSVSSSVHLLSAGKLFSNAGYEASYVLEAMAPLEDSENILSKDTYFTDNIIKAGSHLENAIDSMAAANNHLAQVRSEDVPVKFQDDILAMQSQTSQMEDFFESALSSMDIMLSFLGHETPKTYLLAFQNSTELRATGGFIGSYGTIKLNKGNVDELFVDGGGIYNPDGQLKEKDIKIIPPKPLRYVTPHWGARDANWFFDFSDSASKILEFYKQAVPDSNAAGVVAITPNLVEELLKLTGPIEVPAYGQTITSENFIDIIRVNIEENKTSQAPKQIMADFAPLFVEKLSKSGQTVKIANILFSALQSRDIQLYSHDAQVQSFLQKHNWAGRVRETAQQENYINDYLAVVLSNIGGAKADRYTDTEIDTTTTITREGDILRTIVISRKHNGGTTPYFWYNKSNYGYIRFYVPKGSQLISAEGFSSEPDYIQTDYAAEGYLEDADWAQIAQTVTRHESGTDVFEESGKTVFGNWMLIRPQERKFATITYRLPYDAGIRSEGYNLTVQKQAGAELEISGAVEEGHKSLDIASCKKESQLLSDNRFQFKQLKDQQIQCEISSVY